jgi:ribosome biogenesis GTPase
MQVALGSKQSARSTGTSVGGTPTSNLLGAARVFDNKPGPGKSTMRTARVITVDRERYTVRPTGGEDIQARLSGRFRHEAQDATELPCAGDRVVVEIAAEVGVIHEVLPRDTVLRRKRPGKDIDFQLIAANIDVAFIVQGCDFDFNVRRLDRYLVVCRDGGIRPVILLSKTDLVTEDELAGAIQNIRDAGVEAEILSISNVTGEGLNGLTEMLEPGLTYCLLGSSGVGKTTLINRLLDTNYETQECSATGEGVHTTTRRQLIEMENGAYLVDTPGMRELGILDAGGGISESFSKITDRAAECRFSDCTHTHEPGCAVRGSVDEDELASYHKLVRESERNAQTYHERRQADRQFGKQCKAIMKHKKEHKTGDA